MRTTKRPASRPHVRATSRGVALLAAVALAAPGCDALLGLGEPPSGGDDAAASTGATATGDATVSGGSTASAGGGGGASSSGSTSGPGGGGEGGAGGGPAEPAPACGACDAGCERCDVTDTRCVRRTSEPIPILSSGNDLGSQINRLGRGVAVTPDVVAFWAISPTNDEPSVHVVDRQTLSVEAILSLGPANPEPPTFHTIAATADGRIVVGNQQGLLREVVRERDGWALETLDLTAPPVSVMGAWGPSGLIVASLAGEPYRLDPSVPASGNNPCRLAPVTVGSAPMDVRIEPFDGAPTAMMIGIGGRDGFDNPVPVQIGLGPPVCPTLKYEAVTLDDFEWGMAIAARGDRIYAKGAVGADGYVILLDASGAPVGQRAETNLSRALAVRSSGVLVPGRDGGLDECPPAFGAECSEMLAADELGQVQEIAARDDGFIALGYVGEGLGAGDALVACVDESE